MSSPDDQFSGRVQEAGPRWAWRDFAGLSLSAGLVIALGIQKWIVAPHCERMFRDFGVALSWSAHALFRMPDSLAIKLLFAAVCATLACFALRRGTWIVIALLTIANLAVLLPLLLTMWQLQDRLS